MLKEEHFRTAVGQQGQERMRGRALPHLASRRPGTQRKTEPGAEGMARGPAEVHSVKGWVAGQWLREEKAEEVSDLGRSFCVVCPAKKKETDGRGGAEEPLRGASSWRWACGMPIRWAAQSGGGSRPGLVVTVEKETGPSTWQKDLPRYQRLCSGLSLQS